MIEYRFLAHDNWDDMPTVDIRYRVVEEDAPHFIEIDDQLEAQFLGLV